MMKTILVADDEFDILNSIRVVLETEGYSIVTCGNGQEALELVSQIEPDLIITDTTMPHLNGPELLRELTKRKARIPAIVMSNVQPTMRQKELKYDALLMKPFTLDQLITTVRRVIKD